MKKMIDFSKLTKTEKTIMEFLLDEYRSLEEEIESGHYTDFIEHYRDQTGYIMNNIEGILKREDLHFDNAITPKQKEELIKFLSKEYAYSTDTVDPIVNKDATYIEGIENEARFFASSICTILGLDAHKILKEPEEQKDK